MLPQFSNQMATLNVAAHSRMNSRSSMPNNWWKATMGGTVDSPTPMVPISSDSTSVMSSSSPNCFDSAMAATQPAVPPPAMTTFLTAPGCGFRVFHRTPFERGWSTHGGSDPVS